MEKRFCDICGKEVRDIKLADGEEYGIHWFHGMSQWVGDWDDICPTCLYAEINKFFKERFVE